MVAEGLSQLGRSADGTMQVFLSLSLRVGTYNFLCSFYCNNLLFLVLAKSCIKVSGLQDSV